MDFFPKLFENNQLKNEVLIQYNSKLNNVTGFKISRLEQFV